MSGGGDDLSGLMRTPWGAQVSAAWPSCAEAITDRARRLPPPFEYNVTCFAVPSLLCEAGDCALSRSFETVSAQTSHSSNLTYLEPAPGGQVTVAPWQPGGAGPCRSRCNW